MKVAIVGAGITGLAAALFAGDRGAEVVVHEALPEAGGVLQSVREDGLLMERGPDAFVRLKPASIRLCERLGVELIPTRALARGQASASIVRGGRLHPLPEGLQLLAPTRLLPFAMSGIVSWPAKLRMALDLVLPRRRGAGDDDDESLASFVRRRLGSEALDRIAQPLVAGIFSGDPETLSLRATMPRLLDLERDHRSLVLGMRRTSTERASGARYSLFVTPARGMAALVDALTSALAALGVRIVCGSRVSSLSDLDADRVVLALPAPEAAGLLDGELARLVGSIRCPSSATVNFAWRQDGAGIDPGYGFVVPSVERRFVMACTVASTKYEGRAPAGMRLLRAYVGGALGPDVDSLSDAELTLGALSDLRDLAGLRGEPERVLLTRHRGSQPQYDLGHLERVRRVEALAAELSRVGIAGNWFSGVGVADCIESARRAVERVLAPR